MAITFTKIADEDGTSDHMWEKTRNRKWWVFTTLESEGQNAIEAASGLTYYDPHPNNNSTTKTFLASVSCTVVEDLGGHAKKWLFIASYKSQFPELRNAINMDTGSTSGGGGGGSGGGLDPTGRNIEWESDDTAEEEEIQEDINGDAIETTAGEPVTGVRRPRTRGKTMFTGFRVGIDADAYIALKTLGGKIINDAPYHGFPEFTLRFEGVRIQPATENGYVGHRITEIHSENFDWNGPPAEEVQGWLWTPVPNRGFYHIDPADSVKKLIREDGRPSSVPRWINLDTGEKLPLGAAPRYRYFQLYEPMDFSFLPLAG